MWTDIAYLFVSCSLFIHLGLGDAICRILRIEFVLLRCVKCLTFWTMVCYTALHHWPLPEVLVVSFTASYLSLWASLLLGKLADAYEKLSEQGLASEEPEHY